MEGAGTEEMTITIWAVDSPGDKPIVVENVRRYELREGLIVIILDSRKAIYYNLRYILGFNVERQPEKQEATDIE